MKRQILARKLTCVKLFRLWILNGRRLRRSADFIYDAVADDLKKMEAGIGALGNRRDSLQLLDSIPAFGARAEMAQRDINERY